MGECQSKFVCVFSLPRELRWNRKDPTKWNNTDIDKQLCLAYCFALLKLVLGDSWQTLAVLQTLCSVPLK